MSESSARPARAERLQGVGRVILFFLVTAGILVVLNVLAGSVVGRVPGVYAGITAYYYILVAALLLGHYVALRWIDRNRPWSFVGLGAANARPTTLGAGLLMGAAAIGVPSLVLLATGQLRVVAAPGGSWWESAFRAALMLIPAALFEELMVRGYAFATLREVVGWKLALIVTSVVFGLLHLRNPGASAETTLLVMLAGFFLGLVVLVTRSLYAAWAAHFAWNFVMAAGLHTAVSGTGLLTPDYRVIDAGPDWLTGGAWGPEGGLAAGVSMFGFLMYLVGRHLKTSTSER